MSDKEHRGLLMIESDLQEAQKAWRQANKEAQEAAQRCTIALNKLNVLQKEFDESYQALKKSLAKEVSVSDWGRAYYEESKKRI